MKYETLDAFIENVTQKEVYSPKAKRYLVNALEDLRFQAQGERRETWTNWTIKTTGSMVNASEHSVTIGQIGIVPGPGKRLFDLYFGYKEGVLSVKYKICTCEKLGRKCNVPLEKVKKLLNTVFMRDIMLD